MLARPHGARWQAGQRESHQVETAILVDGRGLQRRAPASQIALEANHTRLEPLQAGLSGAQAVHGLTQVRLNTDAISIQHRAPDLGGAYK